MNLKTSKNKLKCRKLKGQGATIRVKIIWQLEDEKFTKYFLQKLEKRKRDQDILSLKSKQNNKIIKNQ